MARNIKKVDLGPLGVGTITDIERIRKKQGWKWSQMLRYGLMLIRAEQKGEL